MTVQYSNGLLNHGGQSKISYFQKNHTSIILLEQIIGPDLTPTITTNSKTGIDFNTFNGTYYIANKKIKKNIQKMKILKTIFMFFKFKFTPSHKWLFAND
jgi:hypothetical protein